MKRNFPQTLPSRQLPCYRGANNWRTWPRKSATRKGSINGRHLRLPPSAETRRICQDKGGANKCRHILCSHRSATLTYLLLHICQPTVQMLPHLLDNSFLHLMYCHKWRMNATHHALCQKREYHRTPVDIEEDIHLIPHDTWLKECK